MKNLDQYEKELRESIKRIQAISKMDWRNIYVDRRNPEYFKSKFGDVYNGGHNGYDN